MNTVLLNLSKHWSQHFCLEWTGRQMYNLNLITITQDSNIFMVQSRRVCQVQITRDSSIYMITHGSV